MVGDWAAPVVPAFTALACLTSLGSWMMLVSQAGACAAKDGNFPKIYGELDKNGIPRKGLILASVKMTILMLVLTAINSMSSDGRPPTSSGCSPASRFSSRCSRTSTPASTCCASRARAPATS